MLLAINDTAADVQAGLSTLVADTGEIASITASNGPIVVSAATFLADQSALDKIVGGFAISDTADVIVANLDQLNDPNISAITISDNGQISASVAQLTTDATAIGDLQNANGSPVLLAINDTAGDVQTGLSTLVQDTGEIGSITTSYGPIVVSAATFLADQSTLDKIVGGFDVSDAAANLVADLSALNADSDVDAITADIGDATLSGGAGVNAPNFSELGWGTSLTVSEALAYAGAFSQGSGSTTQHIDRRYAFADGNGEPERDDERGRDAGLGRRERDHQQRRATISVSQLVDLRRRHGRDARREPQLRGVVQRRRGRHVRPVGRPSPAQRRGDLRRRDGGRLEFPLYRGDDDGLRPDDRRDRRVGKHQHRE